MSEIRYRHPYQVVIRAQDLKSGKKVFNVLYFRNRLDTGGAYGYGDPIAASSLDTFLTNFRTGWETDICPVMSVNYKVSDYLGSEMLGMQYPTLRQGIVALTNSGPTTFVTTAAPLDIVVGSTVFFNGVTKPAGINGLWRVTSVTGTDFQITAGPFTDAWTGDGTVQRAAGRLTLVFGDSQVKATTGAGVGGVSGEAFPLFDAVSIWKKTSRRGRSWRGRVSTSPHGESQGQDGRLTSTALAAIQSAWTNQIVSPYANGGSDTLGSGAMVITHFSPLIAKFFASPWLTAEPFVADLTLLSVRPNFGSIVRRKPKLDAVIP